MPQPKVWVALVLVAGASAVWIPRFLPQEEFGSTEVDDSPATWEPRVASSAHPLPPPTDGGTPPPRADGDRPGGGDPAGDTELDAQSRALLELARSLRGDSRASETSWSTPSTSPVDEPPTPPPASGPSPAHLALVRCSDANPLTATLVGADVRRAVLGGRLLQEGDPIAEGGPRITSIEAKRVRLEFEGEELVVDMAPFRIAARPFDADVLATDDVSRPDVTSLEPWK